MLISLHSFFKGTEIDKLYISFNIGKKKSNLKVDFPKNHTLCACLEETRVRRRVLKINFLTFINIRKEAMNMWIWLSICSLITFQIVQAWLCQSHKCNPAFTLVFLNWERNTSQIFWEDKFSTSSSQAWVYKIFALNSARSSTQEPKKLT